MDKIKQPLSLAERGWHVFPTHGIKNGACTCGSPKCTSPGKHPIFSGGFNIATTDKQIITRWFTENPDANVAIATGEVSNLLVVDVDCGPSKEGFASLAILEAEIGPLPRNLTVKTGGGGLHIYMQMPATPIACSASKLGRHIDVRANGGYVIAPPSTHISGNNYEWINVNEK